MILKIAWRNIYRNKKRSLITITSVFAALFLIILMRALQFGFYDKLIETVVESYAGYVEIHADGFWDNQSLDNSMQVDQALISDIKSVDGVENIVQRLQTFSLISMGDKTKGGVINGVNLDEEQKKIAEEIKYKINKKLNGKVVTKISVVKNYCKAEEYHQKYFEKKNF